MMTDELDGDEVAAEMEGEHLRGSSLVRARLELGDLMETLGGVATLLREAWDDASAGNVQGSMMSVDDALSALSEMEAKASEIAARMVRWGS